MSALTIMIIRHGEKPDEQDSGSGVDNHGEHDKHSLAVRGWQRAGAWTALFGSGAFGPDYPRPDVVYAADPDKADAGDLTVSRRPYETTLPLCARLGIKPIVAFGVTDENELVSQVKTNSGVVLISWEHKKIASAILPGIAAGQIIPAMPSKWNSKRYDVVLRFDREHEGATWSFRQLFPQLMAGDSNVPLKDEE